MKCCAVVDTNVIVSALLSKKDDAATVQVFRAMLEGQFIPLYHEEILTEYEDVLRRPKFHLSEDMIRTVISSVKRYGIEVFPQPTGDIMNARDSKSLRDARADGNSPAGYFM
jgi:predicted nucleic acid-binding protein